MIALKKPNNEITHVFDNDGRTWRRGTAADIAKFIEPDAEEIERREPLHRTERRANVREYIERRARRTRRRAEQARIAEIHSMWAAMDAPEVGEPNLSVDTS